jgi:hypothetical protein
MVELAQCVDVVRVGVKVQLELNQNKIDRLQFMQFAIVFIVQNFLRRHLRKFSPFIA